MKKLIVPIISIGLLVGSVLPCHAKNSEFNIVNENLYSEYLKELNSNKKSRKTTAPTLMMEKSNISDNFQLIENNDFNVLFQTIPLKGDISATEIASEVITTRGLKTASTISVDNINSAVYYIEVTDNSNELLYIVNGEKYIISTEGENVLMKSESNNVLYLSKTETISKSTEINVMARASSLASKPYTSSDDKYFTRDAGPGSKTNKEFIKVLGAISAIGGVTIGKVSASIGSVLAIIGAGAFVGDSLYTTFYIKFWQAYKLADSSYWREKQRWFYDSGFYNHVKDKTTYFYNSRPD